MEPAKLLSLVLVFAHFVASAVALVTILQTDLFLLKRFNFPLSKADCRRIHQAKPIVTAALWALWITGIAICVLGYFRFPDYLDNQKLMMKVLVVEILTLNGLFLHGFAFRFIKPGNVLSMAAPSSQRLLVFLGALSSVSWSFACFLGLARPLNYLPNFYHLLAFYLALLAGATLVGWMLTHYLGGRDSQNEAILR